MLHREVEGDGHQNQQMSVNSTTGQGKGRYQESSSHRFENGNKSHGNQDDDLRMVVCGDEDDEELQLEPDFPSAHMDTNGPDARDSQRDVQDSWALTKKLETLTAEHNATREMLAKTKSDLLDTIKTLEVTKKSEADLRSHLVLLKKQIEKMRVDAKDHDFVTENRIFQANKKADKDGQLIQDLQRTIQDLKKDLTKSNEKIMDLQKDLDTPRTVSPQTASPVSAQATMQQPQQVPFNPFLAMQQQAMQQQALQLQAFKGTPYEGMMMPGTTPNPAMAMNPFAFMPAGMMDPMSLMMMMSKMMPMMQMANMPAMSSPEVKTEAMPDVAASTQGNKRVSVEASQEPLNKKRKEEMNGQQQTVTQSASERQQSNDNARSRYEAPEPRFRRDSLSSRDARYGIRDRRDDHYDSRDRRDDHAESRDRRSSMSTPERRENNNERHDGQFNRRESNVPDRREGGESRPRHDLRERLESGATQRTANVIIYESVDSRARKDSVTSRPAETQPRPAATTPPEAPATAPEPVVTLKPETVVVTKQQPTATLADQFKDSQMTPVSNRTDTIVLEASPDDEEPGQVSEAPVVTSSWDHATTTTYSGWPQSPSPSKSVAGQTMSLDSSRRSSPARTVAATNAGSPSNITIQVSTSNNNDESVTREVALEPIGNSTQERRVIDTTSTQQRPFSRVPRSILDRLQSERKFSDREIIFETNIGISRQFPNEDKPRLLSRDCVLRVQGSWINRIFLPRVEVVEGSATYRRHLNVIMYRNVTLSIRGKTLEFEVNYKNKVVFYLVVSETEDACRELHDIIEEVRREENNKGGRR